IKSVNDLHCSNRGIFTNPPTICIETGLISGSYGNGENFGTRGIGWSDGDGENKGTGTTLGTFRSVSARTSTTDIGTGDFGDAGGISLWTDHASMSSRTLHRVAQ
ncbi:hypothetical protein PMAYCL1PPCAC_29128, partial [Pristionchus mayeri]